MSFEIETTADECFGAEPGETILGAALRQGIELPYGCCNGLCGACAVRLLSGAIDYPSGRIEGLEGKPAGTCLTCQAVPRSALRLSVPRRERLEPIEVRILPCRLERKEMLTPDVVRLRLVLPAQQQLRCLPGQYLNLVLNDGRKRAFSIANLPQRDGAIELHVRRVPGGGFSGELLDGLREQSILRVEAPLGNFVLREDATRTILLVGGGTGFAPLAAMMEHIVHTGIHRPVRLYWGVRARDDLYLPELPRRWRDLHPDFRFTPVLSEPDPQWDGRRGPVHAAVAADYPDLAAFQVYLSGPPAMVEAARAAFVAQGADPGQIFSDAFTPASDRGAAGVS